MCTNKITITRARNGYVLSFLREENADIYKDYQYVYSEDSYNDEETLELKTFRDLVFGIAEHLGVMIYSKHRKYNLEIEIKEEKEE
jgi:hypothetical protein